MQSSQRPDIFQWTRYIASEKINSPLHGRPYCESVPAIKISTGSPGQGMGEALKK